MPVIAELLETTKDEETLLNVVWSLCYISDHDDHARVQVLVDQPGALARLVDLLKSTNGVFEQGVEPIMCTLANVCAGDDQTARRSPGRRFPSARVRIGYPPPSGGRAHESVLGAVMYLQRGGRRNRFNA